MCVCFHGEGRNPCWKYIHSTGCKEHLVFQAISYLAVLGWILHATKEWHWFSSTILRRYSRKIIARHWALYLGKSELKWHFCVKLKILHMPSSPFCMGFSFSVVFGIWMGNACSWLGSCPNRAAWWSGIKRSGVETSSPSLGHCWGVDGQTPLQLSWWLHSEQRQGMDKCKYFENNDTACNGEANKYQPCFCNMFLVSQWCVVCLL